MSLRSKSQPQLCKSVMLPQKTNPDWLVPGNQHLLQRGIPAGGNESTKVNNTRRMCGLASDDKLHMMILKCNCILLLTTCTLLNHKLIMLLQCILGAQTTM